ncbi:hypothetical protein V1520DRAFT_357875 [Lipomyces starkeyi]
MTGDSSPDYKTLFLRAEEERKQAVDRRKQAEDRQRQAEHRQRQAEERIRLGVGNISRSTKRSLKKPTGKLCPTRLRLWADCRESQQQVYNSVRNFLHASEKDAPRLFSPVIELEGIGRRLCRRLLSSEKDLENYEQLAVEDHVHDVIAERCKIPEAGNEFGLGDGVQFDNHANALGDVDSDMPVEEGQSIFRRPIPDQFCVHRVNRNTNTLSLPSSISRHTSSQ